MVIAFPRTDIISTVESYGEGCGFADCGFDLVEVQEISRTRNKAIGKDLGPALWFGSLTTGPLANADALDYMAVLRSLDGVLNLFEAGDIRRPAPRAHSDALGRHDGTARDGTLQSVAITTMKSVAIAGLNSGQKVSRGDYLSFAYGESRALHQAMETVTASGAGTTPSFEVRPHIRPGYTLSAVVNVVAPAGLFSLLPKSIQPRKVDNRQMAVSFSFGQGGLG